MFVILNVSFVVLRACLAISVINVFLKELTGYFPRKFSEASGGSTLTNYGLDEDETIPHGMDFTVKYLETCQDLLIILLFCK